MLPGAILKPRPCPFPSLPSSLRCPPPPFLGSPQLALALLVSQRLLLPLGRVERARVTGLEGWPSRDGRIAWRKASRTLAIARFVGV